MSGDSIDQQATPIERPARPLILRGRPIVGGIAEGEALVSHQTLSGWGGVNPKTGTVIERRHELCGQSFAGRILVIRGAKGSSGWSSMFHICRLSGTAPLALIFNEMTTKIALGAIVMRIPSITDLDRDPLTLIRTGDRIRVDGDAGTVAIFGADIASAAD